MTPEEIRRYFDQVDPGHLDERGLRGYAEVAEKSVRSLLKRLDEAVAEERERCAKRIEALKGRISCGTEPDDSMHEIEVRNTNDVIDYLAVAIRGDHEIPGAPN